MRLLAAGDRHSSLAKARDRIRLWRICPTLLRKVVELVSFHARESESHDRVAYKINGGEGEIRTHVPELPDHPISSRRRYDRFGTSPRAVTSLIRAAPAGARILAER